MNFVVGIEVGHVDFGSEPKARYQLIGIVVKNNGTNLVQGLFVLTSFVNVVEVKRCGCSLDAIAGGEVDADHHGHLEP